jgi:hypothetical protein
VNRQPVALRLDSGDVASLANHVRGGADDIADEHLTGRPSRVHTRVDAALDRVLEGLCGDRLVRRR